MISFNIIVFSHTVYYRSFLTVIFVEFEVSTSRMTYISLALSIMLLSHHDPIRYLFIVKMNRKLLLSLPSSFHRLNFSRKPLCSFSCHLLFINKENNGLERSGDSLMVNNRMCTSASTIRGGLTLSGFAWSLLLPLDSYTCCLVMCSLKNKICQFRTRPLLCSLFPIHLDRMLNFYPAILLVYSAPGQVTAHRSGSDGLGNTEVPRVFYEADHSYLPYYFTTFGICKLYMGVR